MGYSCTSAAMDLLTKNVKPDYNTQNVFAFGGKDYFYEIETAQENEAGDIMGTVFRFVNSRHDGGCYELGKFFISADGLKVIAPTPFAQFFCRVVGVTVEPTLGFEFPPIDKISEQE